MPVHAGGVIRRNPGVTNDSIIGVGLIEGVHRLIAVRANMENTARITSCLSARSSETEKDEGKDGEYS